MATKVETLAGSLHSTRTSSREMWGLFLVYFRVFLTTVFLAAIVFGLYAMFAGAHDITFGDLDFLNGPGHSFRSPQESARAGLVIFVVVGMSLLFLMGSFLLHHGIKRTLDYLRPASGPSTGTKRRTKN